MRHGHARSKATTTPEYRAWMQMRYRCFNPRCEDFARYGGREITVAPEWCGRGGFERFLAHIGLKPEPKRLYSLDRIDPDGNYEPGNVRWATAAEQRANQSTRLSWWMPGDPAP